MKRGKQSIRRFLEGCGVLVDEWRGSKERVGLTVQDVRRKPWQKKC